MSLLPEAQCDRFDVVLVSPRNPLNIGAAARAMANFGFRRLAVVAPFAPTWREARSAIGAPELLQNATEAATLAEAVAGATLVVGTGTLTYRKAEQPVVALPDLAPLVRKELARSGRVAMIFGPEKHGLTREDLSYCHILVEIPTDPHQPSMNLGQAVAVCLYELAARVSPEEISAEKGAGIGLDSSKLAEVYPSGAKARAAFIAATTELKSCSDTGPHLSETDEARTSHRSPATVTEMDGSTATSSRLELLAGLVEETMLAAGYSPKSMQAANRHDLRLMLRRLTLSAHDTRRVLGVFRRILWRLKRGSVCDDKPL
jgi:tRNA/rRNA methyltransferase